MAVNTSAEELPASYEELRLSRVHDDVLPLCDLPTAAPSFMRSESGTVSETQHPLERSAMSVVDALVTPHFSSASDQGGRGRSQPVFSGWMRKKSSFFPFMFQTRWVCVKLGPLGNDRAYTSASNEVSWSKSPGGAVGMAANDRVILCRSGPRSTVSISHGSTIDKQPAVNIKFVETGSDSAKFTFDIQAQDTTVTLQSIERTTPPHLLAALAALAWPQEEHAIAKSGGITHALLVSSISFDLIGVGQ